MSLYAGISALKPNIWEKSIANTLHDVLSNRQDTSLLDLALASFMIRRFSAYFVVVRTFLVSC